MYAYENIEMSLNYIEQHLSEKIETEKFAEFTRKNIRHSFKIRIFRPC